MSSQAQILANRRNALKSTGPRSSQGKIKVSQNALQHGLSAHKAVISSENKEEFELYRDRMLGELEPVGAMESILSERIVNLSWRLKRAGCIQNQTIDAMHAKNESDPLAKLTQSLFFKGREKTQSGPSTTDPELALGRLAIKDFSNSRVLERLLMYERRLEHSLYKTILELQRLQVMRRMNAFNADEAGY